jgi:hypothetical protein
MLVRLETRQAQRHRRVITVEMAAILVVVVEVPLQLVETAHLLLAALAAMAHLLRLVEALLPMLVVVAVVLTQELVGLEEQVVVEQAGNHLRQQHQLHLVQQTLVAAVAVVMTM